MFFAVDAGSVNYFHLKVTFRRIPARNATVGKLFTVMSSLYYVIICLVFETHV